MYLPYSVRCWCGASWCCSCMVGESWLPWLPSKKNNIVPTLHDHHDKDHQQGSYGPGFMVAYFPVFATTGQRDQYPVICQASRDKASEYWARSTVNDYSLVFFCIMIASLHLIWLGMELWLIWIFNVLIVLTSQQGYPDFSERGWGYPWSSPNQLNHNASQNTSGPSHDNNINSYFQTSRHCASSFILTIPSGVAMYDFSFLSSQVRHIPGKIEELSITDQMEMLQ